MLRAMLDANVCIRVLRDRPGAARARFVSESGSLALSTIVLYELYFGAAKSADPDRHRTEVDDLASRVVIVPFDRQASMHAGDIRAELTREGRLIGPNDLLIAGHARSCGLKLITGNLREFQRVSGLACENWLAA